MLWLAFVLSWPWLLVTGVPRFDPTALLQDVLVPADAAVGSIIYRLRASDPSFAYPLTFTLRGKPSTIVSIDNLNCTRLNSICQSNIVLRRRLEPGRFYDFTVDVQNRRGELVNLNCSFMATNATTPIGDIFPGAPTLLMVSENSRRNTELGAIIARGNPARPNGVLLELWGSPQFGLHQRLVTDRDAQGTILLLARLDYEERTVHHLAILANDPWTEVEKDTRNIASWPLLVAVLDEQDTPPIFTLAPPTTTLSPSLRPGDVILKVHAEDGDRGNPRDVRYGLVPEGNPFTPFFDMNDETGELKLMRPLGDILAISHASQPILLTVIADEVRSNPQEAPAQSTTVRLALIPPSVTAGSPTFGALEYNAILDENSPIGTLVELPQAEIFTQPGDLVALELAGNNGTFDISPTVVQGQSEFQIRVHDPKLLDYETWHSVHCVIVAKEIGSGNFTAKAKLNVLLNDVNDNPPSFLQSEYGGSVQEHAPAGTSVLRVEAQDIDREPGNKIKYMRLTGDGARLFELNPVSGLITVAADLDAETSAVVSFTVEAADENGRGQTATAAVTIDVADINDEVPEFERHLYEFILNADRTGFTAPAFIRAVDRDVTFPNSDVHYELITPLDDFALDEITGEVVVQAAWQGTEVVVGRARAWDGGVPRLASECEIRIYPPDGQSRRMVFIVPGRDPDRGEVRRTLGALTGGRIAIDEVRPYSGNEPGATDVTHDSSAEKSVVVATVTYAKDSVVDIKRIQEILDREKKSKQGGGGGGGTTSVGSGDETETTLKESRAGSGLLWLFILLILLALIAAIILVLCCICHGCPLYVPPKRRKIASREIRRLVVRDDEGQGRESKSVQVAEWFGRKEAWSPDHAGMAVDAEAESLRRHEYERGSDKIEVRRAAIQRQQPIQREPSRDQLYIREGNADILRLITRGGAEQRPVTLVAADNQTYLTTANAADDSGKDILMRRFIEQQQEAVKQQQVLLPNAVNKLQTEHELVEASLRQQNALLRQILMDRERDLRLETQSLPAGTQTDHDMSTQTEPQYLRPSRRRVVSDNEASEGSDEELSTRIRTRIRHKNGRKGRSGGMTRKIRTPIQEESELEVVEKMQKVQSSGSHKQRRNNIRQTRTSELRQKRAGSEMVRSSSRSRSSARRSALRKEVLREISASLDRSFEQSLSDDEDDENGDDDDIYEDKEYYSEDSLDENRPRSAATAVEPNLKHSRNKRQQQQLPQLRQQRYHSESDLAAAAFKPSGNGNAANNSKTSAKSQMAKYESQTDLSKARNKYQSQRSVSVKSLAGVKSRSQSDLRKAAVAASSEAVNQSKPEQNGTVMKDDAGPKPKAKRVARYMEWYKKAGNTKQAQNNKEQAGGKKAAKAKPSSNNTAEKPSERPPTTEEFKEDEAAKEMVKKATKGIPGAAQGDSKSEPKKVGPGPEHPLLQHSEYRYEAPYHPAAAVPKRPEEDADSGIALARPSMTVKKSVFTIAYDEMHTSQLRPQSSTSPI